MAKMTEAQRKILRTVQAYGITESNRHPDDIVFDVRDGRSVQALLGLVRAGYVVAWEDMDFEGRWYAVLKG